MTTDHSFDRYLTSVPAVAVSCYVALLATLGWITWTSVVEIADRRETLASASQMLEQLEGRTRSPGAGSAAVGHATGPATSSDAVPGGSPFLEGQTVTIAGAALQQRLAAAIGKFGGSVLSSQVELPAAPALATQIPAPQAKDGVLNLLVSCEIEQSALQQLLYDLEAGMPFLFVEQLVAQAASAGPAPDSTRMRVVLAVTGHWQNGR